MGGTITEEGEGTKEKKMKEIASHPT